MCSCSGGADDAAAWLYILVAAAVVWGLPYVWRVVSRLHDSHGDQEAHGEPSELKVDPDPLCAILTKGRRR